MDGVIRAGVVATTRDGRGQLHLGDFVVGVNGQQVESSADIVAVLDKKRVGDELELTLARLDSPASRRTRTRTVTVRLQGPSPGASE